MERPISLQEVQERFHLSQQQLDTQISEKHLQYAKGIICDHKVLGAELGLTEREMNDIDQLRSPELQRSAVLEKWRQKYAWKATYSKLFNALLKCNRADLVVDLCKLLAQNGQPKIFPSNSPPAQEEEPLPSSFIEAAVISRPKHQIEEEEITSKLRHEVEEMKKVFEDLRHATIKNLEENKVPICTIRRSLCVRRTSDTHTDTDLVAGHQHEIREADTVHHLFKALSDGKCLDFMNPGLLNRIIDNHCFESHSIQHQKKDYLQQLQHFREKTLARHLAKVHKVSNSNPSFSEVVFEMGKDWDSATLEDVENLKQKIRGQGYLSDHRFSCKRPKNSTLSLVWDMHCSCPISTTILRIPPSFYLEQDIRRVLVKGVCVVDVKFEEELKEVAAKQEHNLRRTIEVITADEEAQRLKEEVEALKKSNEELSVTLQKAEQKVREKNLDLKAKLGKSKLHMKTNGRSRSVSNGPLLRDVEQEDFLVKQHEAKERELLQVIKILKEVEGRVPTQPTGDHFVEVEGIRYNMELGGANGNKKEMMILLSVGNEFPADVQVEQRVENETLAEKAIETHGHLPPIVTGLRETTAADLMATASVRLQSPNADLVRLYLDVPQMQRSKKYYLKMIKEFLEQCKQPLAVLIYLGHSEKKSGNWCFKDGTISFQEIFDIYSNKGFCSTKRLNIQTDCCYSGNWVKECAKTLDNFGIPPCGHRAREQGILLKVYASCQSHQKAAEPCYSVKGVTVNEDGTLGHYAWKQANAQTFCGTDFTKLICCRRPDESCQAGEVLKNWKWENAVNGGLKSKVFIVQGKDRGQSAWYFVLLSKKSESYEKKFSEQVNSGTFDVGKWGYIIASGWGEDPPEKIINWMSV